MGLLALVIFAGVVLPSLSEEIQSSPEVLIPQVSPNHPKGVPCEKHSLYYVYTALSKPIEVPGIFEFTGMGMLDGRKIDYYNSEEKIKKPEQPWMKEKLPADYWEKGTQSRKSKEQWFKVNVNILMERKRQNQSDVHVLNWRHGCEVERKKDGTLTFIRGVDEYSYDGVDFLSFDDSTMQWVAPVPEAVQTKRKWDGVPILNQYTKGYLEKECVEWLDKFMKYGDKELQECQPPDVHLFAKASKTDTNDLSMTCFATGFHPKDIEMYIMRGSIIVAESTPDTVFPNGDGTHQARLNVKVPRSERKDYSCYVNHRTLKNPVVLDWNDTFEVSAPLGIGLIAGIAVACLVGGGLLTLLIFGIKTKFSPSRVSSSKSGGDSDSGHDTESTDSSRNSDSNSILGIMPNFCSSSVPSCKREGGERTITRTPSPADSEVVTIGAVPDENTTLCGERTIARTPAPADSEVVTTDELTAHPHMPFWSRLCGRDKMTHHPPISDEDLVILKNSTALQPSNPESLLQKVWFDIQLHFGQRGCEGKRQLKPDSFTLARDENGRQYYTMTFNEETKKNKNPMEKTRENNRGAMYEEPGNPLCPVASLMKYLQKIPADGKALFLHPRQHICPTDDVWYTTVPVGKNQLSQMLPRLSLEAGTKVHYTNHNLRATAIQKLSEVGTPSPADSEVVTTGTETGVLPDEKTSLLDSDSGHDTESTSSSTNLDSNSSGRGSEGSPTEATNLV